MLDLKRHPKFTPGAGSPVLSFLITYGSAKSVLGISLKLCDRLVPPLKTFFTPLTSMVPGAWISMLPPLIRM